MNYRPDNLEQVLKNKSYNDLDADEKKWIDQQYSKEEYNAMRMTLLESISVFRKEQTKPNPEIKSGLMQRLQQNKKAEPINPFFTYRIPAWQAAAAFAMLLFFFPQIKDSPPGDPEQIFIYRTDTVFKEIPFQNIINPLVDTLSDIPQVRKILNRTPGAPIKSSTIVFSKDAALSASLSGSISESLVGQYDTSNIENIINRYLKDSVRNYRVDIDTGFQEMGRIY